MPCLTPKWWADMRAGDGGTGALVARAFGDQRDWTKITTHFGHDPFVESCIEFVKVCSKFVELCSKVVEFCSKFVELCSEYIKVCGKTFGNGGQIYVPETVVPGLSVARAFGDQVSELYTFPSPDVRLQPNGSDLNLNG